MSEPVERDPHEILGVAPGSDAAAVRAAWRRVARQCHPDRGGDTEAFRRARVAFDRLYRDAGASPTLVRRLRPAGVAARWWKRRHDRTQRPRVS
ncbi:MAG TPA: DnaJ domain-containing protein [Acidimicrobiales bacterium]|nr:DnaJ domain-containing protein [Acidimicrobiales bacterium]